MQREEIDKETSNQKQKDFVHANEGIYLYLKMFLIVLLIGLVIIQILKGGI